MPRCMHCPCPMDAECPGLRAPRICDHVVPGSPRRDAWVAKLNGRGRIPRPPAADRPKPAPPAAGNSILTVLACDHRIPLHQLRDEGSDGIVECGCRFTAVCSAGRSARRDKRVGSECYSCPLAGASH